MCGCATAIARAVVAFLDAVLVRCFLSWFRVGPVPAHRDPLVHRERGGDALPDEEKGFGGSGGSHEDSEDGRHTDEELRKEADHLKLCGTISQIPAELQNVSSEINLETTYEVEILGNMSGMSGTSVSEFNSSECFKCQEDHALMTESKVSQVESVLREKSPIWSIKSRLSDGSGSPFPTPLVLTDDLQTPGTIYTSHTGPSVSRKRVRTRKQFVYPVLRPIENMLQQTETLAEDSLPMLRSNTPKCQTSSKKFNSDEKHAELSLTHWLYPSPPAAVSSSTSDKLQDENTLFTESPVFLPACGTDEDAENLTPMLPKAWEGNGIPNTTTKYKEDQKVSWHATPFEERLLRVLSDEPNPPKEIYQRKHVPCRGSLLEEKAGYKRQRY